MTIADFNRIALQSTTPNMVVGQGNNQHATLREPLNPPGAWTKFKAALSSLPVFGHMGSLLEVSRTSSEAYEVIERASRTLFPGTAGAVFTLGVVYSLLVDNPVFVATNAFILAIAITGANDAPTLAAELVGKLREAAIEIGESPLYIMLVELLPIRRCKPEHQP